MVTEQHISKEKLRLWIALLRTTRFIETEVRDRLRQQFGVTLARFDVMAALYRKSDGMKMTELSRHLMVSNGNTTGMVDRLVNDGLAQRSQPDGDRRSWIISLTEAGTNSFRAMAVAHESWINELLEEFSNQESEEILTMLSRLKSDWEENK